MFPDQDRCPFYGCVCWLSSCSDRERQEERERKGGRRPTQSWLEGKLEKREAEKYTGMKREGKSAA